MAKDLEYYLAQARRIAAHREEGAEEAIRKEFKKLLKDLKAYIGEVHEKYAAADGTLSFADLQKAGYDARFLEEIERRIGVATPRVAKELHKLVNETYELSYKSMVEGVEKVAKGADLGETFSDAVAITPEQIKAAVSNPYMENALLRNHQSIVYDIRQAVAVGLMNGDRYTTIANKITVALDKENGPYKNAVLIARTEAHRVREAGNNDAAAAVDTELQKGTTGMRMCKTWKTMKDERVRPQRRRKGKGGWSSKMGKGANHMKLEGQTVLASDLFDLLDHNTAPAPGSSGVAAHDCNCRCYASFAMLTDAEFFALTGKHFPGYKGETAKKQEGQENKPHTSNNNKMSFADRIQSAKSTDEVSRIASEHFKSKPDCKIGFVDFGKADLTAAKEMAETIDRLDSTYVSSLRSFTVNRIDMNFGGVSTPSESSFKRVLDTGDWSHLETRVSLNEAYLKTRKDIQKDFANNHRTMYGGGVAQGAMVDEKYASISTLMHEYGHTICPGKANEVYQQQTGNFNSKFMPFRRMYNQYMRELRDLESQIQKVRNQYAGMQDGLRLGIEAAKDLQEKYDAICISKYSKSSVGEFIAEAFCDAELSSKPKPASIKVKEAIIKLYGKGEK